MQAPAVLIALFGLYSVITLAYGVLTFRTVPKEAIALRQVRIFKDYHSAHRLLQLTRADNPLRIHCELFNCVTGHSSRPEGTAVA